jgi:hypothetical protein
MDEPLSFGDVIYIPGDPADNDLPRRITIKTIQLAGDWVDDGERFIGTLEYSEREVLTGEIE